MAKRRTNPLHTIEGLLAAKRRRALRPFELRRLAAALRFRTQQATAVYGRRVKYALGRGKQPPEPANKTQARVLDAEIVAKAVRPKRTPYKSGQDRLHRKFGIGVGWYGVHRNYNVPFVFKRGTLTVDVDAIREIFRVEHFRSVKGRPVLLRAFVKVQFKDQLERYRQGDKDKGVRWFSVESGGFPTVASSGDTGADGMHTMIMETIGKYEVQRVMDIEIQAYQSEAK